MDAAAGDEPVEDEEGDGRDDGDDEHGDEGDPEGGAEHGQACVEGVVQEVEGGDSEEDAYGEGNERDPSELGNAEFTASSVDEVGEEGGGEGEDHGGELSPKGCEEACGGVGAHTVIITVPVR